MFTLFNSLEHFYTHLDPVENSFNKFTIHFACGCKLFFVLDGRSSITSKERFRNRHHLIDILFDNSCCRDIWKHFNNEQEIYKFKRFEIGILNPYIKEDFSRYEDSLSFSSNDKDMHFDPYGNYNIDHNFGSSRRVKSFYDPDGNYVPRQRKEKWRI